MICLYVVVSFVLPWTVELFPFMLWRWRNKLKRAPFELFAPSHYCGLGASSTRFYGHCEQKTMRRGGYLCRWSSATEWEMYKTPRVFLFPKTQTITS